MSATTVTAAPAASPAVISASAPIVRAMARGVGVGGVVFAGLALKDFLDQLPTIERGWDIAFAGAYLIAAIVLAIGSWFGDVRTLRIMAGALAGIYLFGMLTFLLALPRPGAAGPDAVPWFTTLMVIGASAAAVSFPTIVAWVYLGVSGGLIALDRLGYCGPSATLGTVQSTLFQLFYCGIFVAIAMASRHLGRLLDAAGASAETETRRNATRNARTRERRRIDALMHDNVLSVLLASAVGGGYGVVADQASRALRQIERYGAEGDPEPVTAAQLVWELQSISTEIAPLAEFRYVLQGTTPPPPEIVAAVTEATAEALRNSMIHADPPDRAASRAVHVHLDDGGIAVLVLDDGVGFDPKSVPSTRLGVSVSVVGRMRGLPGGYATIESELGRGTTVRIGWMGP
jgi:signal transduction histidine kinase